MRRHGLNILILLCVGLLVACGTPSPEEQVASLRSQYTAEVVSWRLEQIPQETVAADTVDEVDTETGAVAGEVEMLEVPQHLRTNLTNNVFLDVLVGTTSETALETLTVDITHSAATQAVKNVYRIPLDVSDVARASSAQITTSLGDLADLEEGDSFSAEIRANVPTEERSSYVEFGS